MINLQDITNYSSYLDYFARTASFSIAEKGRMCGRNVMNYLFIA